MYQFRFPPTVHKISFILINICYFFFIFLIIAGLTSMRGVSYCLIVFFCFALLNIEPSYLVCQAYTLLLNQIFSLVVLFRIFSFLSFLIFSGGDGTTPIDAQDLLLAICLGIILGRIVGCAGDQTLVCGTQGKSLS